MRRGTTIMKRSDTQKTLGTTKNHLTAKSNKDDEGDIIVKTRDRITL
jgi:hypothetical protein